MNSPSVAESAAQVELRPVQAVRTTEAECYVIRNGFAWADIFVRHGVRTEHDGRPCTWANVAVISDYGSFGYCWSHMGGGTWQAFLARVSQDYAMTKFMGARYMEPMPASEACVKAKALVLDGRRHGLSKDDARLLWDEIDYCEDAGDANAFLREWDRRTDGAMYRNELWDARWDRPNPAAVGFWREIWPLFLAALDNGALGASRRTTPPQLSEPKYSDPTSETKGAGEP